MRLPAGPVHQNCVRVGLQLVLLGTKIPRSCYVQERSLRTAAGERTTAVLPQSTPQGVLRLAAHSAQAA